ncbi:MAG: ATPase [Cytophagales bacterium]|nr:MAG: ATPase [Cytophagales bacterium]
MEPQPNVGSHLTYFKIENFKRFDSFEMSNLGQFNLIVGDNNVGKTSVLEALLFDEDLDQLMVNFLGSVGFRKVFDFKHGEAIDGKTGKNTEFWSYIFKVLDSPLKIQFQIQNLFKSYSLRLSDFKHLDPITQQTIRKNAPPNYPDDWIVIMNEQTKNGNGVGAYFETSRSDIFKLNIPFLPVNLGFSQDIIDNFYQYINSDKLARREFDENLRKFIPNLEDTRVHRFSPTRETLCVTLLDNNDIIPINRYGDGTVKFVRFLIEVVLAKGKRLMVDEIGSGIHFTRLVDYWKTVIRLCDQYKVQLFATTHSLECQQAFVEALEDPEMQHYQKDARNISLIENKEGEVKAVTYNFEQLNFSLENGIETRGGKRKGFQVWK